eukprot:435345_1
MINSDLNSQSKLHSTLITTVDIISRLLMTFTCMAILTTFKRTSYYGFSLYRSAWPQHLISNIHYLDTFAYSQNGHIVFVVLILEALFANDILIKTKQSGVLLVLVYHWSVFILKQTAIKDDDMFICHNMVELTDLFFIPFLEIIYITFSGLCITCFLLCRSAWLQDSLPNIYHLQTVLYFQNFLTIVIPVTSIAMVKLGEHLLYHIYFGTYEEFIYCLQSIVLLLGFMAYSQVLLKRRWSYFLHFIFHGYNHILLQLISLL